MAEVTRQRLATGLIAATLTPLRADGSADTALLADHCRSLLERGCTNIVLLGTTGEANSFTVPERQSILTDVRSKGIDASQLIVGTGCCALGDTIALTRHALALGVARVLVVPPFYYKKVSDDGLFDAFAALMEGVADDRLRLYLYLIPQVSGIDLSISLIERLQSAFPTQIAGLKDSSGHWPGTEALCRSLGDRMDILVGTETLLLRALEAGASGCVSATANVNAARIADLCRRRNDADSAALERSVNATRAAFENYPMIPALKAWMAMTSGKQTWHDVRPPLRPLSGEETKALMKVVDESRSFSGGGQT